MVQHSTLKATVTKVMKSLKKHHNDSKILAINIGVGAQ